MSKRDLRAELLAAEAEARDKKRKAEGKPPLAVENGSGSATPVGEIAADEESNKRRKLLQEALELDKDEDDEDEDENGKKDEDEEDDEYVLPLHCSAFALIHGGVAGTRTKMMKRMTRLSCCVSSRRSSGNEQRRKRDKNGNSLPPPQLRERSR